MKYYGTKNGDEYGFYLKPFEGAVEVEDEVWADLIGQCASGKIIVPDENKYPTITEDVHSDEELAAFARSKRNSLLACSDWTQLQDSNLSAQEQEKWKIYRQTLRDVPQQIGFPKQIDWPVR